MCLSACVVAVVVVVDIAVHTASERVNEIMNSVSCCPAANERLTSHRFCQRLSEIVVNFINIFVSSEESLAFFLHQHLS